MNLSLPLAERYNNFFCSIKDEQWHYHHLCGTAVKENNDPCLVLWKCNCTCQCTAENSGLQLPGGRICKRSLIRQLAADEGSESQPPSLPWFLL